jgi:hypothetical protein
MLQVRDSYLGGVIMGARIWNNAGNYDANVALVQKFYARTRCTNEENFQTSTH